MNREQIGQYLWVRQLNNEGKKTKKWSVWGQNGSCLGLIRWYGAWRGYAYHPSTCLLNHVCMMDLAKFLSASTKEHLQAKRDKAR